jgi:hypothetical protein
MNTSNLEHLYKTFRKSIFQQLLFITFLAVIIQIFLFQIGFYSISGDESDRSIQAFNWAIGSPVYDASWLPLHKIILGLGLKIVPDLFWTPRIINSFFGILLIPLLAWLAQELFQSKKVTILTSILCCFFFPRIIFTAVPLTENIFIAVIVSAISFYIRWIKNNKSVYILASSIIFLISCTIRYEGWLFSASFGLLVCYHFFWRQPCISLKTFITIILLLSTFPLYWFYYHYIESGSAFSFLFSTTERYSLIHGNSFFIQIKNSLLPQFIFQNIVSINLLGFFTIIVLWEKNNIIRLFFTIVLISFSIMTLATIIGKALPSHNFWRVPAVWSFLLLPFTAYLIFNLKTFFPNIKHYSNKVIVIVFMIFNLTMTAYEVNKRSSFTEEQFQAGYFLSKILEDNFNKKVLIETTGWGYINILVSSQHPNHFIFNTGADPKLPTSSMLTQNLDFNFLKGKELRFFLFKSKNYKSILDNSVNFKLLKVFGEWSLYDLKCSN